MSSCATGARDGRRGSAPRDQWSALELELPSVHLGQRALRRLRLRGEEPRPRRPRRAPERLPPRSCQPTDDPSSWRDAGLDWIAACVLTRRPLARVLDRSRLAHAAGRPHGRSALIGPGGGVSISANGRRVAYTHGAPMHAFVHDRATARTTDLGEAHTVFLAANGRVAATHWSDRVLVRNLDTGRNARVDDPRSRGSTGPPPSSAASPATDRSSRSSPGPMAVCRPDSTGRRSSCASAGSASRITRLRADVGIDVEHAGHRLGAVGRPELPVDVVEVLLDRARRDHELGCDLRVRGARCRHGQDLVLALGRTIVPRRRSSCRSTKRSRNDFTTSSAKRS